MENSMQRFVKLTTLLIAAGLLSSCLHNSENDYQKTYSEPSLKMPSSISGNIKRNTYSIADGSTWTPEMGANLYPPGSLVAKQHQPKISDAVAEMGVGAQGQPALLLRKPFNAAWPAVQTGLKQVGYVISNINQQTNTIMAKNQQQALIFRVISVSHASQQGAVILVSAANGVLSSEQSKALLAKLQSELQ